MTKTAKLFKKAKQEMDEKEALIERILRTEKALIMDTEERKEFKLFLWMHSKEALENGIGDMY